MKMNMKPKDIIMIGVSVLVIVAASYYLFTVLSPAPASKTTNTNQTNTQEFTGNIDQDTLDQVKKLNDYGEAPLDNIGRVNPFGPLN